jgi:hypothetical protein
VAVSTDPPGLARKVLTDDQGGAVLSVNDVKGKQFRIKVEKDGFTKTGGPFSLSEGRAPEQVFELPSGKISVEYKIKVTRDGAAVPGIQVEASQGSAKATTGGDGVASIPLNLERGAGVVFTAIEGGTRVESKSVPHGTAPSIEIKLPLAPKVRIKYNFLAKKDGKPLPKVYIRITGDAGIEEARGVTNQSGAATLEVKVDPKTTLKYDADPRDALSVDCKPTAPVAGPLQLTAAPETTNLGWTCIAPQPPPDTTKVTPHPDTTRVRRPTSDTERLIPPLIDQAWEIAFQFLKTLPGEYGDRNQLKQNPKMQAEIRDLQNQVSSLSRQCGSGCDQQAQVILVRMLAAAACGSVTECDEENAKLQHLGESVWKPLRPASALYQALARTVEGVFDPPQHYNEAEEFLSEADHTFGNASRQTQMRIGLRRYCVRGALYYAFASTNTESSGLMGKAKQQFLLWQTSCRDASCSDMSWINAFLNLVKNQ